MKIELDRAKCAVLGICESVAPDFFEITEDGDIAQLREDVPADKVAELEEAVQGCPTEALRLVP
ncbi:ferredoxin [Pseudonocardia sp. WMMC193]|uniref:ferredoxin n=1 Tax=Pseudonocardia sp. WMMC193 TaxID=2911965 RepID=UPI001F471824|nr:ferredoxin [Pseudonocardia sp. WMMC193]MCF7548660.1 ferredoxin [Pseudonocardia sp. WMMC193]